MSGNTCAFDASLLSSKSLSSIPQGYNIRPLQSSDFNKGFLALLSQLTTVGIIDAQAFEKRLQEISNDSGHFLLVIEELDSQKIVGSGSLIIERKFIHECGLVGHIEDIVIDEGMRGKNFGKLIIHELLSLAKQAGAYKVLLDCKESNIPFYEKCGMVRKEITMAHYFSDR